MTDGTEGGRRTKFPTNGTLIGTGTDRVGEEGERYPTTTRGYGPGTPREGQGTYTDQGGVQYSRRL